MKRRDVMSRFWAMTRKSGDCILWTGGTNQRGYGRFWDGDRMVAAHRFAYEQSRGPIGEQLALHTCDTPACVNHAHIVPGTALENSHDCIRKGRFRSSPPRGTAHPLARLTDGDVLEIRRRRAAGARNCDLAEEFGVSRSLVSHVVYGFAWPHIGGPVLARPKSTLGLRARRRRLARDLILGGGS